MPLLSRATGPQLVLWGESLGSGVAVVVGDGKAGRPRYPGGAVHVRGGGRRHDLLVHAGRAADERSIPLRRAHRQKSPRRFSSCTVCDDRIVPYAMGERMFDLTKAREAHRALSRRRPRRSRQERRAACRRPISCRRSGLGAGRSLLRHGHQFEHVAVRITEIDAAAAAPIVELAVVETPRRAAESDFRRLDAAEDGVEFAVADMERQMMALELICPRRTTASATC